MDAAVSSCKTYVAAAMNYINANAYAGTKLKIVSNLHYPGYAADNAQSSCRDATTGASVNLQSTFLPKLAAMNYWMCEYARQKGFQCADNFAQYMGADYDSNGDGQVDSDALRYVAGESESSYVARITSTLRSGLAAFGFLPFFFRGLGSTLGLSFDCSPSTNGSVSSLIGAGLGMILGKSFGSSCGAGFGARRGTASAHALSSAFSSCCFWIFFQFGFFTAFFP
jgi:hypothetical protein